MGNYVVEIRGVKLNVSLIDDEAVLNVKIAELKDSLKGRDCLVVGVDLSDNQSINGVPELLILSLGNCCLIIQLCRLNRFPESLSVLLADKTICFVFKGVEKHTYKSTIYNSCHDNLMYKSLWSGMKSVVELCELAVRVLKKPNLSSSGFAELGKEVGIYAENSTSASSAGLYGTNWKSIVFTNKEIMFAIQNAYASYCIGDKLLGMVA